MKDSTVNLRRLTIKVLVSISEMYPNSSIAKKLDSEDQTYEAMVGMWQRALDGISEERINRGLANLLKSGNTFEPSMPEFVGMCKSTPAAHRPFVALPSNDGRPAPHEFASINHYQLPIQIQLKKIGMTPLKRETHHDFCMRCKEFVMQTDYGKLIGA